MATPHVSGVAALLWSANPSLTNTEIRTAMQATAFDLGPAGRDNAYGFGLVQAYDAWVYLGGGGTTPNQPPVASFTYTLNELAVTFTDASADSDGTVVVWSWNFGDGNTSTVQNPSHTYAAAGTYTVSLTVTDDDGAEGSTSQPVTVTGGGGGETNIYVSDIAMSGKKAGVNRSATAVVTISDTDGNPVSGATVYGTWSGVVSGSVSGTTGANGTVTFESAKVRTAGTFTFTVDDVIKDGATYIVEPKPSASTTVP
jgi:PKD repeat protein